MRIISSDISKNNVKITKKRVSLEINDLYRCLYELKYGHENSLECIHHQIWSLISADVSINTLNVYSL